MEIENVLRQFPRPSRLDTISRILRNIQKGATMKLNELSSIELGVYVKFLVRTDLLREKIDTFEITEKGERYLEYYKEIKGILPKTTSS